MLVFVLLWDGGWLYHLFYRSMNNAVSAITCPFQAVVGFYAGGR